MRSCRSVFIAARPGLGTAWTEESRHRTRRRFTAAMLPVVHTPIHRIEATLNRGIRTRKEPK